MTDSHESPRNVDRELSPEERDKVTTEGEHAISGGTSALGGDDATINGAGTSAGGMSGGYGGRDNPENTARAIEKAQEEEPA